MKRGKGGAVKRRHAFSIDAGDAARLQEAIELHGTLTNGEVAQVSCYSSKQPATTCMRTAYPRFAPDQRCRMLEARLTSLCLVQILHADAAPCALYDKRCAGKADNPNCLCGLIPAPTGHRRQGLWQKDAAALAKLGPDPSSDKREVCAVTQSVSSGAAPPQMQSGWHTCLSTGMSEDVHACVLQ